MSKICDRKYGDNSLYSLKEINGIKCCPLCEKPALAHGKSIEYRILIWLLSEDTGISSKAIARWMGIGEFNARSIPPSDADDRGRCIRLLELIPEWIPRLNEMAQFDQQQKDTGIMINSSGISAYENSWKKQIPLILQEGKL